MSTTKEVAAHVLLLFLLIYATVIDSPVSITASNELDPFPLKLTLKLPDAAAVLKITACVCVSITTFVENELSTVTFSARPWILPLPFNVTLPVPFGVILRSMFVSPPVAAKSGAFPVAAFVTSNWFTADAVFWNTICSLPESSLIPWASSNWIFCR